MIPLQDFPMKERFFFLHAKVIFSPPACLQGTFPSPQEVKTSHRLEKEFLEDAGLSLSSVIGFFSCPKTR